MPTISTGDGAIDALVDFIDAQFGVRINDADLQRFRDELASGTGRDPAQLRSDILRFRVGPERLSAYIEEQFSDRGVPLTRHLTGATEDPQARVARITNEFLTESRQFGEFERTLDRLAGGEIFAPVSQGRATSIPAGARLVRVTNPKGADAPLYFALYPYAGIEIAYEIGDQGRFSQLFPEGISFFGSFENVSQAQFDSRQKVLAGSIDEQSGATESVGSQIERQMRSFGLESLPDWARADPQATLILSQGALEGWSAGRTLRTLSQQSRGFKERFPYWDAVMKRSGGDEIAAQARASQLEQGFRSIIRRTRGPNADVSPQVLEQYIRSGWEPNQALPVLEFEQSLRRNPEALQNFNEILVAQGLAPVDEKGFAAFSIAGPRDDLADVLGQPPAQVFDAINDALFLTELEEAGFGGLDVDFVRQLKDFTGGVVDEDDVAGFAQEAALQALRFRRELEQGRFDITTEELIAAAAGEPSPTGRSAAEVGSVLARFIRERQAAAGGFEGAGGFLDERGRLRIPGFESL